MASRFLVFFLFGVVLARPFFPIFRQWIPKRCKGVHCVDLGESFLTSIYLQNVASIQTGTSPARFARSPRTDPPGLPCPVRQSWHWLELSDSEVSSFRPGKRPALEEHDSVCAHSSLLGCVKGSKFLIAPVRTVCHSRNYSI